MLDMAEPSSKRARHVPCTSETRASGDQYRLQLPNWRLHHLLSQEPQREGDLLLLTHYNHQLICCKKDLSDFSEYFRAMFSNSAYLEATADQVELHDVCGRDLEGLLKLHYQGEEVRNG